MLQGAERDHVRQNHLGTGRPSRTQSGRQSGTQRETDKSSGIERAADRASGIKRGTVRKFSEVSKV